MLARLDVRVASVHSKLAMDAPAMTQRMVAAVRNPRTNVLGPLHRAAGHRQPRHPQRRASSTPARSSRPARSTTSRSRSTPAPSGATRRPSCWSWPATLGCLFSIDSDAHAPGQLDFLAYGAERAEAAGIEPERIVNTWPAERLLAWANG